MINQIQNIAKIQEILNKSNKTEFNSTLPIAIKVLKKTSSLHYMLQIGKQQMETKSMQELMIGGKYWAEMKTSKHNTILISNLVPQPKLALQTPFFMFTMEQVSQLLTQEKKPAENLKNFVMERLSTTTDKNEFSFLSNMLLSLQQHVLTIPFFFEDRFGYAQFKKKQSESSKQKALEFYALFQNLGSLEGKILELDNEELALYLKTPFPKTKAFLESELDKLRGFSEVHINIEKEIKPFYEFSDSLLDLKG